MTQLKTNSDTVARRSFIEEFTSGDKTMAIRGLIQRARLTDRTDDLCIDNAIYETLSGLTRLAEALRATDDPIPVREGNCQTADKHIAQNNTEEQLIAVCRAAEIGVMRTLKAKGMSLDEARVKELKSDAVFGALTHVNPEFEGALSYANKCGENCVRQAAKRNRYVYGRTFISYDAGTVGDKAWEVPCDETADGSILAKEEKEEEARRAQCLMQSVASLSAADKTLFMLCAKDMHYSEIALRLDCSESTARKKAFDLRKKVRRAMVYYGCLAG